MRAVVQVIDQDDGRLAGYANRLLEVVIDNNRDIMRQNSRLILPLRETGVRFRAEPWAGQFGIEEFCPLPALIERGWGDCAQLCAWRVAELRERGDRRLGIAPDLRAQLHYYCRTQGEGPNRRRFYHVEVRRGDGTIEDPSMILEF